MKASALRHRQPQTTEFTGHSAEHFAHLLVIVELVSEIQKFTKEQEVLDLTNKRNRE